MDELGLWEDLNDTSSTSVLLTDGTQTGNENLTSSASSNQTSDQHLDGMQQFQFNRRLLLNVIAYSVMFVIGTIGNSLISVAAYRQNRRPENNGRTNVHVMVLHLTIADLIVSFVVMPLEIGWRLSVQWYVGNVACKVLMFIRAFAFYLSSMTLVCLSIDRYLAISQPLASMKSGLTRKRGRVMITIAWIVSALFALPQTLVFRVLKHPEIDFFQCTSMGFFDELLKNQQNSFENETTNETFQSSNSVTPSASKSNQESCPFIIGMTSETAEKLYNSVFLIAVYIVPLFVIIVTYWNIIRKIIRNSRGDTVQDSSINHINLKSYPALRRNHSVRCAKNNNNTALRMSFLHVLAFIACWTPYLVISLWHIIDGTSVEMVAPEIQDALFLTAVFNSCIDPIVYGGFYFRDLKRRRSRNWSKSGHLYN